MFTSLERLQYLWIVPLTVVLLTQNINKIRPLCRFVQKITQLGNNWFLLPYKMCYVLQMFYIPKKLIEA